MKRRCFLMYAFVGSLFGQKRVTEERRKFYITGLVHTPTANDCTIPPTVVFARDRLDALMQIVGVTVWTEEEWQDMRNRVGKRFDESCKAQVVK